MRLADFACSTMYFSFNGTSQRRSTTRTFQPCFFSISRAALRAHRHAVAVAEDDEIVVALAVHAALAQRHRLVRRGIGRQPLPVAGFVQVLGHVQRDRLEEHADPPSTLASAASVRSIVAASSPREDSRPPGRGCRAASVIELSLWKCRRSRAGSRARRCAPPSGWRTGCC